MKDRASWAQDARVLADIGLALSSGDLPRVEVRLPGALADLAVAAWERDDADDDSVSGETVEQRQVRHRAAALALIGLSVHERGPQSGDVVVVELSPELLGDAFHAADDVPSINGNDAASEEVAQVGLSPCAPDSWGLGRFLRLDGFPGRGTRPCLGSGCLLHRQVKREVEPDDQG